LQTLTLLGGIFSRKVAHASIVKKAFRHLRPIVAGWWQIG